MIDLQDIEMRALMENAEKIRTVINEMYKIGEWVYPGTIQRVTKMKIRDVDTALTLLEHEGSLKRYHEACCPNCQHSLKVYVEKRETLTKPIVCKNCKAEVRDPASYTFDVFRLL